MALRVRRSESLMPAAWLLALGLLAAYVALRLALGGQPLAWQAASHGLIVLAGLAATVVLFVAANRAGPELGRTRQAWRLLALGHLFLTLGDAVTAAYEVTMRGQAISPLADVLYVAYYPLILAALFLLPSAPSNRGERLKLLLDVSILSISAGLLLWAFWLGPEAAGGRAEADRLAYALVYPAADLGLFFAALVIMLRQRTAPLRPLALLAASLLVLTATDFSFGHAYLMGTYASGGWLDAGWLVSYALLGLAGAWQAAHGAEAAPRAPVPGYAVLPASVRTVVRYLPFLIPAGVYVLLVVGRNQLLSLSVWALGLSVAGLLLLVLVRQVVSVNESRQQLLLEQRRREADAVLLDLSSRLLGATSEAAVAEGAVEVAARALLADGALLVLPDEVGQLRLRASVGYAPEVVGALAFAPGAGSQIGYTIEQARPVLVEDYAQPRDFEVTPALLNAGLAAGLSVPMLIEGRVVGAMVVHSRGRRRFDADAVRLLALIANQAGAAIERVRLFEVRRRQLDELTVLHAVATAGAEAVSEDDLIERVTRIVGDKLYSDNLGVMLLDRASGVLRSHPSYRGNNQFATPLGVGITGHVALTGQPARVGDVSQDPRYLEIEPGNRSELCVPLAAGDMVLGVLNVESQRPNAFSQADERLLVTIARQLATALEKLRLFERVYQAEQQRAGELEAVRQASLGLTASLDLQAVLRAILQSTLRLVPGAQEAIVFLYHTNGHEPRLTFGAARSRLGVSVVDWEPRPDGMTYHVARTGEIVMVPDTHQHAWFADAPPEWGGAHIGLPLKIGARVVGVMNVTYPQPREFAESELRVLRLLSDQAAIAIENARLFEGERAAREQAEALREVAATLNASLDRERLLQLILEQLKRVVAYDTASVMLYTGETLEMVAQTGLRYQRPERFPPEGVILAHVNQVLEQRQPLILADTAEDPRWQSIPVSEHIRCWLGVPLVAHGRAIGLLNLDKVQPHYYTERDAALATAFANQAAVAIENARLFEAERRQLRLAQTLQAVGALLTAQMTLPEVFENIFDLLAQVVDYDSVAVQLLQPDGSMEMAAGRGFPDLELARETVRYVSEKRRAEHWLQQRVIVIPDTQADPRWIGFPGNEYIRSWIGAALVVKGKLVGTLTTDSATPNAYDAAVGETVQAFANQAAVAIENARLFDESQRQTHALAGLYNTALATGSVLEPDVLLNRLYDQVRPLLNPDTFVVAFYHAGSEELEVVLALEEGRAAHDAVPSGRLPVTQGLAGWVTRRRRSLLVGDLQAEPLPVPTRQLARPARSWLGVPLIARERTIGAVVVQSYQPFAFDSAHQRFLESMASQVAIAIENARLYAEVSARANELARLYAAAQDLGAKLEPRVVLEQLARHLTEAVDATSGYVLEVDLGAGVMTVLAEYWSAAALAEERVSDLGRSFSLADRTGARRAISRLTVVELQADDPTVSEVERSELQAYGVKSALIVPIMARGEVLGQGQVWESRRARRFTLAERRLLQTLCQHAAGVIENARLFEETLRHADEVTTASEVLHVLNATANVAESFPAISAAIKSITGCERVSLAMLDEQRSRVTMLALDSAREELPRGVSFPVAATAAAKDVLAGNIHLTPDLAVEREFPAEQRLYEAGYRSRLNLPLRVGTQVIGAVNLVWREASGYLRANLPLLSQLADAIALAIEKTRLFEETRRRDAILGALAYASGKLLLPGTPDEVMPDVLTQLGRSAGVSRAYIFQNQAAGEEAGAPVLVAALRYEWTAPSVPPLGDLAEWQALPYVEAGFERWMQTLGAGSPLDGLVREFPPQERARIERHGALSLAVVPIFSGGEWWGWLGFDDCAQERIWSEAEIEALRSAAAALGAYLARDRIEAAEREQRALAEALRDTAAVLNSTLDLDEVLDRILADVGHVVPHESANIMLIDEGQARVVRNRDLRGRFPQHVMLNLRYPVEAVPNLRYMLETGQPAIIVDTQHYPGWLDRPETRWIRSLVGAPILIKGQVIGFITLDHVTPGFYTLAHAERLQAFAYQAGLAIENARLYASIREHAEELEQRVLERTRELAEANARLQELDRLKDMFVSNVSHELRTPLTNIKLHLGLLEKRGPDVLARYLPTLQRETERLRRLIEDLLDLSRLQTQTEPLRRDLHPVDDLLAEVMAVHAARADAKGLTLRHEPNPVAGLAAPVDRAQMIQVFTNLIGNAVAYTPPGGLAVVSSVPSKMGTTNGVSIRFYNNGPPIPDGDLPHLFHRFYRGRTAHDSGEPGTGLGLAICKEIVERHGGQIEVTSGQQGTTFVVWLPLN